MSNDSLLDESTESRLNILDYKLGRNINNLRCSHLAQGQAGSYCKLIGELLIEYIESCANEIKTDFFNKIKTGEIIKIPKFKEIKVVIEKRMNPIFENVSKIFYEEIFRTFPNDKKMVDSIAKELLFQSRCMDPLNVIYNQFESELTDYLLHKKLGEATLEKAQEANEIARSSKQASWCSLVISLLALIVSIIVYFSDK